MHTPESVKNEEKAYAQKINVCLQNIILIMCRKENVWGNDELELEREQGERKMQPYDKSKEIESKRGGADTEQ